MIRRDGGIFTYSFKRGGDQYNKEVIQAIFKEWRCLRNIRHALKTHEYEVTVKVKSLMNKNKNKNENEKKN